MPKDEKSLVVKPEFNAARVQYVTHNTMKKNIFRQGESGINSIIPGFKGGFFEDVGDLKRGPPSTQPFSADPYKYTMLHMAVDNTDPPAACELIRLGALIDAPNGRGQTPLL
jgi:ankyrin repeat protein